MHKAGICFIAMSFKEFMEAIIKKQSIKHTKIQFLNVRPIEKLDIP